MSNYELTDETIIVNGITLYRIKALTSFRDVRRGDLGGFVEGFYNLRSKSSTAWVYNDAMVFGGAIVTGQAEIRNRARVFDKARVKGKTCISDDSMAYGYAEISGKSTLSSESEVSGYARVRSSHLENSVKISGYAYVQDTHLTGDLDLSGDAHILNKRDIVSILNIGESNSRLDAYRTRQSVEISYDGVQGSLSEFKRAMKMVNLEDGFSEPMRTTEDYAIIKFIEVRFGVANF